ncbi:hypothetical protein [Rickettsia endosymbiont of Orchestes rusci]|uniref:hypothetical protein n=1 Tax=Rickettsia endosymbiont of Orchestes rusci TaxID=3066250 RepID=UPI00313DFF74
MHGYRNRHCEEAFMPTWQSSSCHAELVSASIKRYPEINSGGLYFSRLPHHLQRRRCCMAQIFDVIPAKAGIQKSI